MPRSKTFPKPEPALQAAGVSKRFGALEAVKNVTLRLEDGRSLALLGPNGAGKTTLMEMLEGLQAPDGGSIRVFGRGWQEPGSAELRSRLGICLQETRLPEKLRALEVLELFASFHRLPASRARKVLEEVGLEAKAKAYTETLSGGQRQRLGLGVAMLSRPKLLLLDEPTTGLDPSARRDIWGLVKVLKRSGCALLLTTHYMEEAEELCDEVALMHQGSLLARGTVGSLLAKHGRGLKRRPTPKRKATLEDLFLKMTGSALSMPPEGGR